MRSETYDRNSAHSTKDAPSKFIEHILKYGKTAVEQDLNRDDVRRAKESGDAISLSIPCDITNRLLDALRFVEFYRSDLLIDIDSIREEIFGGRASGARLLGFRKNGVDHTEYVEHQFDGWYLAGRHDMMSEYYRKLYCLAWETVPEGDYWAGTIKFRLIDATECHPYADPFAENYGENRIPA